MKLIRVNLKSGNIEYEAVKEQYKNLGGRGLTSTIIYEEVDPQINPLSSFAKLIIAPGLLTGTSAPSAGRLSVGAKSPLTNGIKEANVGGRVGTYLARNGIKALIIEDQNPKLHLLLIEENNVELFECSKYQKLGNYALTKKLYEKYGRNIAILSVGLAGENGLKGATVASNDIQGYPSRHAGRGGMGAVMGTRGLKAIVIKKPIKNNVIIKHEKVFKKLAGEFARHLVKVKYSLSELGTASTLLEMNAVKGLPTKNFRYGVFPEAEKISAESLRDLLLKRGGKNRLSCSPGCVIGCSNSFVDEKGNHVTSSLEYETMCLMGSNLLIADLDVLARIDRECDDIGIDTIEMGGAIGVVMEAGLINWGDGEQVLSLINKIREETKMGLMIGNGVKNTGDTLKVKRVPQVKGQGFPAYDPRVAKAMGVTFCTSPMGADHTSGPAIPGRQARANVDYGEFTDNYKKVELSRELQIAIMLVDTLGFCYFIGPDFNNIELGTRLLNAKNGTNLSLDDMISMGKMLLKKELDFNDNAGISRKDIIPKFFESEPSEPTGLRWDLSKEELEKIWYNL